MAGLGGKAQHYNEAGMKALIYSIVNDGRHNRPVKERSLLSVKGLNQLMLWERNWCIGNITSSHCCCKAVCIVEMMYMRYII